MKGIVYVNSIPEQFAEIKDYVHLVIRDFYDLFDLNCKLKVEFIESLDANEFEVSDGAVVFQSVKSQRLLITNSALNTIFRDGGRNFNLTLYHEFAHIQDFVNMMQTQLFKFNISRIMHKDYADEYVGFGFRFWTEVFAYKKTIREASERDLHYEKVLFRRLVENYKKTDDIKKRLYDKQDLTQDEVTDYIKTVDSFVYLCAKFMASFYAGHSRIPFAKIDKDKDYKKVYKILCGFEPKIKPLFKNPYSPKSYENLLRLGRYICEDVRWKIFNVGLTKYKGRVRSIYWVYSKKMTKL